MNSSTVSVPYQSRTQSKMFRRIRRINNKSLIHDISSHNYQSSSSNFVSKETKVLKQIKNVPSLGKPMQPLSLQTLPPSNSLYSDRDLTHHKISSETRQDSDLSISELESTPLHNNISRSRSESAFRKEDESCSCNQDDCFWTEERSNMLSLKRANPIYDSDSDDEDVDYLQSPTKRSRNGTTTLFWSDEVNEDRAVFSLQHFR